ncbi:alpha-ketoglutarate-dependent dioxygenase AlkB family protein [Vibrio metoecus]|uniref:alpha-ketoglutarate-dependent dioxygenase AlkB family protein n=1 Tax=Vibrio metoecus TaxID=1481663 RepID=UPI00215C9AF0|nr:alpha-ketoglutarate-dependent dioxygenase AlkB [Vibrio metoecus]MCR9388133.1 alpha-ketoglutarate-dependent dioxygenase AlkB [Vibrio metoecus]
MMKALILNRDFPSGEITQLDGQLAWFPQFLALPQADEALTLLKTELNWQQKSIRLFGKSVLQPRLIAWYGAEDYRYSGLTLSAHPFPERLAQLKTQCEEAAQTRFNSVLANLYRDGQDSMGGHQDNEPELGTNPIIASLSLGESRRFLLCHKQDPALKIECELSHGDLLIMAGTTQHCWQHAIPKTRQTKQLRINLTFRNIRL